MFCDFPERFFEKQKAPILYLVVSYIVVIISCGNVHRKALDEDVDPEKILEKAQKAVHGVGAKLAMRKAEATVGSFHSSDLLFSLA
jgi:hypothetical protein